MASRFSDSGLFGPVIFPKLFALSSNVFLVFFPEGLGMVNFTRQTWEKHPVILACLPGKNPRHFPSKANAQIPLDS